MGKGVPRNLTSKKVKTLSKAHSSLSPSLNSRSGAIIRQKQLTKCQQLTSQIHPNKCTNLTQASVGLLYRPKAPPVKAPLASKKKETQRRQNLKKSLKTNSLSSKIQKSFTTPPTHSMNNPSANNNNKKKSTPTSTSGGSASSSASSFSSMPSHHRDAQSHSSEPLQQNK